MKLPRDARLHRLARPAITALVVAFVVITFRAAWGSVREDLRELSLSQVMAAPSVLLAVGYLLAFAAWRVILTGMGYPIRVHDSGTIFFAAQLGKYVPGGALWPAVIQAQIAQRNGVPRRTTLAAT